jgi:hypothetical protein
MDGIFSADFLFSVEKRMRVANERNYMKLIAAETTWWPKLLKEHPLDGKSERFIWLLDTASIDQLTPADGGESGGQLGFDELATITQEYFPAYFGRGYRIGKLKLMNMMNGGLDPLTRWAGAIGTYGAYIPQRLLAQVILNGENIIGYDGVNFFSAAHPVHPLIPGLGTYANLFTGAPSGSYPGALPIDDSVTVDVALTNLTIGLSYIASSVKQPNGAGDPRMLTPKYILHPRRMQGRVAQLLNADTIAQTAGNGVTAGGGADVRAVLKKFSLAEPVLANELGSSTTYTFPGPTGATVTVTGDDKTYYIVCDEADEGEIGAFLHNVRLPFYLQTYTGEAGGGVDGVDAILGRSNDIEYHYKGWQAVNPGHPFGIFKFKGA